MKDPMRSRGVVSEPRVVEPRARETPMEWVRGAERLSAENATLRAQLAAAEEDKRLLAAKLGIAQGLAQAAARGDGESRQRCIEAEHKLAAALAAKEEAEKARDRNAVLVEEAENARCQTGGKLVAATMRIAALEEGLREAAFEIFRVADELADIGKHPEWVAEVRAAAAKARSLLEEKP